MECYDLILNAGWGRIREWRNFEFVGIPVQALTPVPVTVLYYYMTACGCISFPSMISFVTSAPIVLAAEN